MQNINEKNIKNSGKNGINHKNSMKYIGIIGIVVIIALGIFIINGNKMFSKKQDQNVSASDSQISGNKVSTKKNTKIENQDEAEYGKIEKSKETVTLNVCNEFSSYNGIQEGWMADILLEKFNVELNIVPGVEYLEENSVGNDEADIMIFGMESSYKKAFLKGELYNWEKDNLLDTYGTYIKNHLYDDLLKNKKKNKNYLAAQKREKKNKKSGIYGIMGKQTMTELDGASFLYTWDIRWDLYKQLDYPEVKNLDDLFDVLQAMKALDPRDDSSEKAYAASLWKGFNSKKDGMIGGVKELCYGYYGVIQQGDGFYNPQTKKYYKIWDKKGPYVKTLQWYNKLYRAGLLDPDSKKLDYEDMVEKVQNGSILFSPVNYLGGGEYNTESNLSLGKMMASLQPQNAVPVVYQANDNSEITFAIGADSKYPELAMQVLNYITTPEGMLTVLYGPKDKCWKYDEEGNTCFTELGKQIYDGDTEGLGIENYRDFIGGRLQFTNYILSVTASNPESAGDTFDAADWEYNYKNLSEIQQDWQKKTGYDSAKEYLSFNKHNLVSNKVKERASLVSNKIKERASTKKKNKKIVEASWDAIYAKSEKKFWKSIERLK